MIEIIDIVFIQNFFVVLRESPIILLGTRRVAPPRRTARVAVVHVVVEPVRAKQGVKAQLT